MDERDGGSAGRRWVRSVGRFAGGGAPPSLDEQTFSGAAPRVRAWVVVSVLTALALPLARASVVGFGFSYRNVGIAAGLMLASVCNIELGRLLDRAAREQQRPHKGLSAWAFASVILLPAWYLIPVVAVTYTHAWLRDRHLPRWKWVGSASYMVLAALVARLVQRIPSDGVGLDIGSSLAGVALVAASCLLFMVTETSLLVCFVLLNRPHEELWLRRTLTDPLFFATEFGVLSLGAITGLVAAAGGWYVLLVAPLFLLMQQAVLHRPLQERADIDAKTGALQYRVWLRAATPEVSRLTAERRPWAVLFVDIDHFHQFNQRHGHLIGDQALAATAEAIRTALPPGIAIGRFGGEEFCALLPGAVAASGLAAAERVRMRVGAVRLPLLSDRITVSVGVGAVAAGEPVTASEAMDRADGALYQAKRSGRDCCRVAAGPLDPVG